MKTYEGHKRLAAKVLLAFLVIFFIFVITHSLGIAAQPQVAAGHLHTVGLKSDGTAVGVGINSFGESKVSTCLYIGEPCDPEQGWTDLVQVSAGGSHTVGLKTDGTVVSVGKNDFGQCNVGSWTDIVQVSAGFMHTAGLTTYGTVVAVGYDVYGTLNVGDWTNIAQVAAGGDYHTVGLKTDGTVVVAGHTGYGLHEVDYWDDIVQVAAGRYHTVGLTRYGTVMAVGWNDWGQCNVGSWTDIVQVAAGWLHTVGVTSNGTVVAVGWNDDGQCNVGGWTDIVQVAAGKEHTVGLKSDGTVVAVGNNGYGQCNVSSWHWQLGATDLPPPPTVDGTGIQATGTSSNILDNVQVGEIVQFAVNAIAQGGAEVNYRFFTRAGYGQPDWGGNKWTIVQDYSPANSVMVTFDTAGTYFLVVHIEYPGGTWEFGDPQSGIVVEVSDPSGTGIQITGTSSNIAMNVMAGDSVEFTIHTVVMDNAPVEYRFFTRAGYGEPDWGGNKWTIVQPYSSNNTVMYTFDTPGIYFLAAHVIHPGDTWAFGFPQSGIVVEVWPVQ